MASHLPITSDACPIEMLVVMLSRDFPDLADQCNEILSETDIPRELRVTEVRRTIELYQLRLEAGLIGQPDTIHQKKHFLPQFLRKLQAPI